MSSNSMERRTKVLTQRGISLSALSIILFLLLASSVSALETQTNSVLANQLEIAYPKFEVLKQNQAFNISINVYNSTTGVEIKAANCSILSYNFEGQRVTFENFSYSSNAFHKHLSAGNFSILGDYNYNIYCEALGQGGFADGEFSVTASGFASTLAFYMIFILIIICIFVLGYSMQNNGIMSLGSIAILFLGFFIILNGIDVIKSVTTTRAIGIIVWAIAIIAIFKSAEEGLKNFN